ncbi:molybdopterin-binding protein [Kutzneria buriramensis]|uniref:Molybdopterin-dependent oxidoreductase-like protein n=1 Tax=Kutzneria buriramensis TaxID=1045776 RepID=A0A3E0GYE8_9PSEU|nr:molybdopterin-binding protein [Kutzneria buriramensis]REH35159.1 hypothetical protein BCF44_11819 [Kutzneria buriramensis]
MTPLRTDELVITGEVATPGTVWCTSALHARACRPLTIDYVTRRRSERHEVRGVALYDALAAAGLALDPARKMDHLSLAVLAEGADGYAVLVSYAEMHPEFGDCGALLATWHNGSLLPRPTLVMPADRRASRFVRQVHRLHVVHPLAA